MSRDHIGLLGKRIAGLAILVISTTLATISAYLGIREIRVGAVEFATVFLVAALLCIALAILGSRLFFASAEKQPFLSAGMLRVISTLGLIGIAIGLIFALKASALLTVAPSALVVAWVFGNGLVLAKRRASNDA